MVRPRVFTHGRASIREDGERAGSRSTHPRRRRRAAARCARVEEMRRLDASIRTAQVRAKIGRGFSWRGNRARKRPSALDASEAYSWLSRSPYRGGRFVGGLRRWADGVGQCRGRALLGEQSGGETEDWVLSLSGS